jgi:pyruvate ferredoxin oxidoreductase gamma subunit
VIEVRWHGRAGQGAKTVSHLLAVAMLDSGDWVQAFPDYGPERSGAPMRAYNRSDTSPVRRRSAITQPDAVVVIDASLLKEENVAAGLGSAGILLVNTEEPVATLAGHVRWRGRVLRIPADRLAAAAGVRHANVVMLGALARVLQRPRLVALERAVSGMMSAPRFASSRDATLAALAAGYEAGGGSPEEIDGGISPNGDGAVTLGGSSLLPRGGVVVPAVARRLETSGWRTGQEPAVDFGRCVNCLLCWLACPDCAFTLDRQGEGVQLGAIDYGVCKGCELCVEVCPADAITMVADGTHLAAGAMQ